MASDLTSEQHSAVDGLVNEFKQSPHTLLAVVRYGCQLYRIDLDKQAAHAPLELLVVYLANREQFYIGRLPKIIGDLQHGPEGAPSRETDYLAELGQSTWRRDVIEDAEEQGSNKAAKPPRELNVRKSKQQKKATTAGGNNNVGATPSVAGPSKSKRKLRIEGKRKSGESEPYCLSVKAYELKDFAKMVSKGHPAAMDTILLSDSELKEATLFAAPAWTSFRTALCSDQAVLRDLLTARYLKQSHGQAETKLELVTGKLSDRAASAAKHKKVVRKQRKLGEQAKMLDDVTKRQIFITALHRMQACQALLCGELPVIRRDYTAAESKTEAAANAAKQANAMDATAKPVLAATTAPADAKASPPQQQQQWDTSAFRMSRSQMLAKCIALQRALESKMTDLLDQTSDTFKDIYGPVHLMRKMVQDIEKLVTKGKPAPLKLEPSYPTLTLLDRLITAVRFPELAQQPEPSSKAIAASADKKSKQQTQTQQQEERLGQFLKAAKLDGQLEPWQIVYAAPAGSSLYDLKVGTSDDDYFIVYQDSAIALSRVVPTPGSFDAHGEETYAADKKGVIEYTAMEIRKYCESLMKGNPRLLEPLLVQDDPASGFVHTTPAWHRLKAHCVHLITQRTVFQYLVGFCQFTLDKAAGFQVAEAKMLAKREAQQQRLKQQEPKPGTAVAVAAGTTPVQLPATEYKLCTAAAAAIPNATANSNSNISGISSNADMLPANAKLLYQVLHKLFDLNRLLCGQLPNVRCQGEERELILRVRCRDGRTPLKPAGTAAEGTKDRNANANTTNNSKTSNSNGSKADWLHAAMCAQLRETALTDTALIALARTFVGQLTVRWTVRSLVDRVVTLQSATSNASANGVESEAKTDNGVAEVAPEGLWTRSCYKGGDTTAKQSNQRGQQGQQECPCPLRLAADCGFPPEADWALLRDWMLDVRRDIRL